VKLAALLPKGTSGDPTVLPAREALSLATSRGAEAIHLEHLTGSLVPGKRADIAVVELAKLHSAPTYSYNLDTVYTHLVYSSRAADVRDVLVDGRFLMRDRALLTLDEQAIIQQAQRIAEGINRFLSGREEDLLNKIAGIGGVRQAEIFEIQVKALVGQQSETYMDRLLQHADISITKTSERTQYDTYFLFEPLERGRIRIREDHRTDPGARPEPKYTITLMAEAERGDFPFALLLSRARYTAPADRTLRFYREYFHPQREMELEKRRRRWRIQYKGVEFAINLDTMVGQQHAGPFLEIKSRTWSRKDASERAHLIGELLALCGIEEHMLVKQEYIDIKR
jgi:5-methylthioadenosine/S-adenosylhomocysteine deaminase